MSSSRRGRTFDFLLPFLILICVGVIIVLAFQLYMTWKTENEITIRNQVFLYYDDGKAQLLPWGADQWTKAYPGSLVLEGDSVKTDAGTQMVLTFFNGAVARLDENTTVTYRTFSDTDDGVIFALSLESGRMWLSQNDPSQDVAHFSVNLGDIVATSLGTIFEVTRSSTEKTIRVVNGSVQADVFEARVDDSQTQPAIATQVVNAGEQLVLTTNLKARILARETVNLLSVFDADWQSTEWYTWNHTEDLNPTDFAAQLKASQAVVTTTPTQDATVVQPVTALQLTLINPPSSPFLVDGDHFSITGTATPDIVKVTVTAYLNNTTDVYALKKFVPGSGSWNYAAALSYGNLEKGDTRYVIVGEDVAGVQTQPLEVVLRVE